MKTFVVRLWTGSDELASELHDLRGVLEEVTTGEATRFTRGEELLDALARAAKPDASQPPGGKS